MCGFVTLTKAKPISDFEVHHSNELLFFETAALPRPRSRFIVTQGPLHPSSFSGRNRSDYGKDSVPDTCSDFVHMLWALDVQTVVMLCQISPGYQGCSAYFASGQGETMTLGDIEVETEAREQEQGYQVSL